MNTENPQKEKKKKTPGIAFKSLFGIVLLLFIFAVIVSWIGFNSFTKAVLQQYADGAFQTADAAALLLKPDRVDDYEASEGETTEYKSVWKNMTELCNRTGVTFIYVIQPDQTDYAHITFLFSTINKDSKYTPYEFGYVRETTNDEYKEKYRKLLLEESEQEYVVRDKGYIETDPHITAMVPVIGADGHPKAILCVQRQMDELTAIRNSYLLRILRAFVVLAVLVVLGQVVYLHKVLLSPIQTITDEASRFARENVASGTKLTETIQNRDEIGQLAESVDRMEEQIQQYVENLTQITAEKERISTEMSLAARIQENMLPNEFPAFPDRTEFDIFASMDPAREVGGDFYDYFLIDRDHLCLEIADVSGKGVPAALFMMASKIILANNAMMNLSPAEILGRTNAAICTNNREEMFVTVWLGILELSTGKLRAANAGHEYPALRKPDGSFELVKDKHGFVIGGFDDEVYKEYELTLEPGAKLFVYTDGVPEAMDAEREQFGTGRMLAALNQAPEASPETLLKNVRAAVDDFVREAEQFDDLTMLCLEIKKNA